MGYLYKRGSEIDNYSKHIEICSDGNDGIYWNFLFRGLHFAKLIEFFASLCVIVLFATRATITQSFAEQTQTCLGRKQKVELREDAQDDVVLADNSLDDEVRTVFEACTQYNRDNAAEKLFPKTRLRRKPKKPDDSDETDA